MDPTHVVIEEPPTDRFVKFYAAETKANKDGDIEAYVSTETIDRVGDSIPAKAWELDNFIKTAGPVLAFHEYGLWSGQVPVVGNAVKIEKQRKGLYAVTRFHQKTQLSRDLAVLYRDGHMNSFSVGFRSLLAPDVRKDEETGGFLGYLFTKVELLEYSVVAVPANPDAVVRAYRSKAISAATASFIAGHSPTGGITGSGGDDNAQRLKDIRALLVEHQIKGMMR